MRDTWYVAGTLAAPGDVVTAAGPLRETPYTGPNRRRDLDPDLPDTEGARPV
ncbi:hypothetical protein [Streptomyces sp. HUAS TT20]|uniref:hypothetical protein n=1 Tax=Streptomyces sp. HUAS TT20 TaxID=3447509 RepID=UPI0021D9B326|nr:hypothetical protein [Streptomyces sp. HUAS 15-9]UXY25905.1 hypothetical protein N8I87_04465 [Streptomyces sp. HUAS 15-9]